MSKNSRVRSHSFKILSLLTLGFVVMFTSSCQSQKGGVEPVVDDNKRLINKLQPPEPGRYNILWIMTDQQRADSLGCYGNTWIKTPNLDALAQDGVAFTNCHVQSPVCVPSRTSMLTSMYPHQTGVIDNSAAKMDWAKGVITFPEIFAQNGYKTINIGKVHTPKHNTWQNSNEFKDFPDEVRLSELGEGVDEKEYKILRAGGDSEASILSGIYPSKVEGRTPVSHHADLVIDQLRELKDSADPFLLRVSILMPHTPVLAPEEYYNMYNPDDMKWDVPSRELWESLPKYEKAKSFIFDNNTPEQIQRMRATYYGLVSHIDAQIGRIIEELKNIEKYDNTIIVFSSDHGNLIGEYGRFTKFVFRDITTRVPFIISGPGISKGLSVGNLVEMTDMAPTLLEACGIPIPAQIQGRSVFAPNLRENVIGEIRYGGTERSWIRTERWSMDFSSTIRDREVTTAKERDGKLIDLQNDPLEHKNLYYDPQYADIVTELHKRFEERTSK